MTLKLLPLFAALTLAFSAQSEEAKKPTWDVNHPPGPSHSVNIDTRTGTWMSVDVSPDGKTLVFDLLGDLYTLPMEGGEARSLTHSVAWEQQARFSPDGKKIAFTSDAGGGDNIWVMDVDGSSPRAVTKEDYRMLNNPVWLPNGQYLLARKHYTGTRSAGSGEIWLFAVDGVAATNKGVQLNEKPNWQKDLGEPAVSPDGRYLYYSHDSTPGKQFEYNKNANAEIFRIYRQDLKDGGDAEAFVTGAGGSIRPTPSPDGKYLAFVRRIRMQSTLFIKDLKSGIERPVWGHLERDLQESWSVNGVYPAFAWTPDAKALVLWAGGKLWRVDPSKADGSNATEIPFHVKDTRDVREALRVPQVVAPDTFPVRELRWVNVSPDGGRVVYSAMGKLYLKSLPNGDVKRITKGEDMEMYPSFSRDGKQLVYTTWNDEKLGTVRLLDLASGRETVLTREPGRYESPSFSPDGKRVAYVKGRGGFLTTPWWGLETGVYLADTDGKAAPAKLTDKGTRPQFGAESDTVYVQRNSQTSEVDSVHKLVRISISDHKEVELAKSDFATEYAVSPDGKQLGFVERFHAYVTALPQTGKLITVGPKMDALPVRQLDVNAGENMHWSGDSQRLNFSLGDTLFSMQVNDAKAKATEQKIGFTQASDKPKGRIVLTGARIATMKGSDPEQVIENGVIVVDGNRIAAIGAAGSVTVPADAKKIDVAGKTIIPGMIDVHWHGAMGDGEVVPQQSWVDYASLALGLTTIHDPSNANGPIFTQSEMQRAGLMTAPRIYSTGVILYGAKAPYTAVINNLDDALTHLRRQQAHGAISVKSYNQPRRDQRQQVIEAASQTGMMVVPEGGSLFQTNMTMVVDGHTGVEHALPVPKAYDDVKQLWSQTRVGYTPTYIVAYGGLDGEHYWYAHTEAWKHPLLSKYVPRTVLQARAVRREIAPEEDYNVLRVAESANELSKAGVEVHIGAHGQREGLGAHWELWTAVLGGMTPLQAIRTATLNGARYLGLDKDIGSLEVGKLADLVVIDGDVLKDIRQSDRIQYVMQNGRVFEAATMNQVAPIKTVRKPLYFEGAQGAGMPVDTSLGDTHGED